MGLRERVAGFERRLAPWQAGSIVFAVLLALRAYVLADPPYWDTLMGAFPQALWLRDHGFDVVGLLTTQKTYVDGGPNVYPFSAYPPLVAVLYTLLGSPRAVFVVLHVFTFACAAACAGAFFGIARRRLPAPAASVLTIALVSAPLFQASSATLNMDMPLAACTALSFAALDERKFRRAWLWALVALLVKPTAVILIGANLVSCALAWLRPRWTGLGPEALAPRERARARNGALAHALLFAVFVAEVLVQSRYASAPAFITPFGGFAPLFLRRLWVVPEYGLGLVFFFVSLPLFAGRMFAGRARWIQVQCAVFLVVFVCFYGQYGNTLPRYFLQSYPYLFLWLALLLYGTEGATRVRTSVLAAACLFHVVNTFGTFYPSRPSGWTMPATGAPLPGNDGYILERSMEYRDDLLLNREIARALERFPRFETVLVPNWALLHLLALPELGYVAKSWTTASPDNPLDYVTNKVSYRELYDTTVSPPKLRGGQQVLWVLTPNTFQSPQTRLVPATDELVDTVRVGKHTAFLVRRRGWE